MSPELSLARSLAATVAVLWLACIVVGLPPPERDRFLPWLRLQPRLAILGAVSIGLLFLGIAGWEALLWPFNPGSWQSDWPGRLEGPSRTLSSGGTFVGIAVVLAAVAAWIGERSRVAARGAMLFALVLLAGAAWPVLSIPRWCAWLGAPPDLPEPSPLAAYRPDCDPARWLDGWSRDLMPLVPYGMLLALLGIGASLVFLRRATMRGNAQGRESACAAIACCGLLAVSLATLEFEKYVAWEAHAERVRVYETFDSESDGSRVGFRVLSDGRIAFFAFTLRRPSPPPSPDLSRLASPAGMLIALAAGFAAALFGEFHLRGRRVLREPAAVASEPGPP